MADYLSDLVAKNQSPQENIQPRLHSRFEPPSEAYAAPLISEDPRPLEQQVEHVAQPAAREARHSPNSPSQEPPAPATADPFEQKPAPRMAPEPIAHPPLEQPYRGRLDRPASVPPVGESTPGEPAQVVAQTQPAILQPLTEAIEVVGSGVPETTKVVPTNDPARSNHFSDLGSEQVREVVVERHTERILLPTTIKPAAQEPASQSTPIPFPLSPESPSLPTASPTPIPPTQELHPVTLPLPDLAPRSAPSQPNQTINVSIGRIEVRATPSPAAPPRKPAPAPRVMSLDEYLQSRSNGGRQ